MASSPVTLHGIEVLKIYEPAEIFTKTDDQSDIQREMEHHLMALEDGGASPEEIKHYFTISNAAVKCASINNWSGKAKLEVKLKSGVVKTIEYSEQTKSESGFIMIDDYFIAQKFDPEFADLADNFEAIASNFPFASDSMKKEVLKYLPTGMMKLAAEDGSIIFVIPKTQTTVSLSEIMHLHGDDIPEAHIAWIGSGLLNILCYLESQKLANFCIVNFSIFIDYKEHVVRILPNWEFATPYEQKIKALPQDVAKEFMNGPLIATAGYDRRSILKILNSIVTPFGPIQYKHFIEKTAPNLETAPELYRGWRTLVESRLGKPKFVELTI